METLARLIEWANENEGLLQALAMLGGIGALLLSFLRQRTAATERAEAREPVPSKLVVGPVPESERTRLIAVFGGFGGEAVTDEGLLVVGFGDADDAGRAALEAWQTLDRDSRRETAFLICERTAPVPELGEFPGEIRVSPAIQRALLDATDLHTARHGRGAVPFVLSAAGPAYLRRFGLPAMGAALVLVAAGWWFGWGSGETTLPHRPRADAASIAVLPFANLGEGGEHDFFADGVTEDIIGSLGRFSDLIVIAWSAVRHYRDAPVVAQDAGRALNVRYTVDGSIRRSPERVRVSVQLTEAKSGVLLWSNRFDRPLEDIFAVQDEVVLGIVGALATEVRNIERSRAQAKPTDSLSAYEYSLRGRQRLQELTRSSNLAARDMFERALELDPNFAAAHAALGWTYNYDAAYGWTTQIERALHIAEERASEALRLDPNVASAYTLLSQVHVYHDRLDLALDAIDRSIELNPSSAESHAHRSWVMIAAGHSEEAVISGEMARRFDPNSLPVVFGNLGWAYFLEGRHQEAVGVFERAVDLSADYAFAHIGLTATYAALERWEEARKAAAEVRRVNPFFDSELFAELFKDADDRELAVSALREAGLE